MMAACLEAGVTVARGLVVTSEYVRDWPPSIRAIQAGYPTADHHSQLAGREALALARATAADDAFLVLLSGGAEVLLVAPAADLSLDDEAVTAERLAAGGASPAEVAVVLKHLSAVRGGGLADAVACPVDTFAVADVAAAEPETAWTLGGGLTVADPTTWADAIAIVGRCGGGASLPAAVAARLAAGARGEHAERLRPSDPRAASAHYRVVAGPKDALQGAVDAARFMGYSAVVLRESGAGESYATGAGFVAAASESARGIAQPVCILASLEPAADATGARQRPFAWAVAAALASSRDAVALACVDTAGADGTLDGAGACVDPGTLARATASGVDATKDAAARGLARAGDVLSERPSTTAVGGLQVLVAGVPPGARWGTPSGPPLPVLPGQAVAPVESHIAWWKVAIWGSVLTVSGCVLMIGTCLQAVGAMHKPDQQGTTWMLMAMTFVTGGAGVLMLLVGLTGEIASAIRGASIRRVESSDRRAGR
jgi:glycerate 2-kinase